MSGLGRRQPGARPPAQRPQFYAKGRVSFLAPRALGSQTTQTLAPSKHARDEFESVSRTTSGWYDVALDLETLRDQLRIVPRYTVAELRERIKLTLVGGIFRVEWGRPYDTLFFGAIPPDAYAVGRPVLRVAERETGRETDLNGEPFFVRPSMELMEIAEGIRKSAKKAARARARRAAPRRRRARLRPASRRDHVPLRRPHMNGPAMEKGIGWHTTVGTGGKAHYIREDAKPACSERKGIYPGVTLGDLFTRPWRETRDDDHVLPLLRAAPSARVQLLALRDEARRTPMTRRRHAPPPPPCERCGELCPDRGALLSITGERLCRACHDEELEDLREGGEDYSIGIETDADDIGLARPFSRRGDA